MKRFFQIQVILMSLAMSAILTPAYAYYEIRPYIATFEVSDNTPDIRVILDITYNIENELKNSGFKFIGYNRIEQLKVLDETDRLLKSKIEYLEGTKISWYFPSVSNGKKRVIVKFVLKDALRGSKKRNFFKAAWVGVFEVPVYDIEYRFIFPSGYVNQWIETEPPNFNLFNGKDIEVHQSKSPESKVLDKGFIVDFSPGVIETKIHWEGLVIVFFSLMLVAAIIIKNIWMYRRKEFSIGLTAIDRRATMNTKPDFHIRCDPETEKLTVAISMNNPDLIGKSASFTINQLVDVKESLPIVGIRTVFTHSFTIHEQEIKIPIDGQPLPGFDYSGTNIDIELHCKLIVEDVVFFETKVEKPFSHRLLRKPEVSNDAEWLVEPEDYFNFFSNLRALPFDRGMALYLAVIGLVIVIMAVIGFVGIHDAVVPVSETYIWNYRNHHPYSTVAFFSFMFSIEVFAGTIVLLLMRALFQSYMTFNLKPLPTEISRQSVIAIADLVEGSSLVDLENVSLRVVACNMEKGKYRSWNRIGGGWVTVSFSEPVRGVLLYEQQVARIPRKTTITTCFEGEVEFAPMFNLLYPPYMVSENHGLGVYWEVQLRHSKLVDQELICPVSPLREEDFYSDGS